MIEFDEILIRYRSLERRELLRWVEERWVLPEQRAETWVFHEVDVARIELIIEIRRDFAVDDEAMPLVLSLLDQVYSLRRQMRRLCDAVAAQPEEIRTAIHRALPAARRDHD
jgi:chaperone modulatory protein CbpM